MAVQLADQLADPAFAAISERRLAERGGSFNEHFGPYFKIVSELQRREHTERANAITSIQLHLYQNYAL